jgi:hypothetical protein
LNKIISFISTFKKFFGLYDRIQRSAIYSWGANGIHSIVPSNEKDTQEVCSTYPHFTVIDGVKRAREIGFLNSSPILKDLIDKALPAIDTTMVGLIKSDIILPEDFSKKCELIFQKYGYDIFIVSSRISIRLNYLIDSSESYKKALTEPRLSYPKSDLFITSKFLWRKIIKDMPEFIFGRYCWDDWLQTYAETHGLKKYNCTEALTPLHCDHPSMIAMQEGAEGKEAPSSKYNFELWKPKNSALIKYWEIIKI